MNHDIYRWNIFALCNHCHFFNWIGGGNIQSLQSIRCWPWFSARLESHRAQPSKAVRIYGKFSFNIHKTSLTNGNFFWKYCWRRIFSCMKWLLGRQRNLILGIGGEEVKFYWKHVKRNILESMNSWKWFKLFWRGIYRIKFNHSLSI